MAESLGRRIRLSPGRRVMDDFLHAGMQMPLVTVQRDMNLADVMAARHATDPRPSWSAIFTKAYAKAVASHPEMRRAFLSFPWQRIFEYSATTADIAVEARVGDEDVIVFVPLRSPATFPLLEIDEWVAKCKAKPLEHLGRLRQSLRLARLPRLLRRVIWWGLLNVSARKRSKYFGTFGVTSVGNWGVESIRPIAPSISVLHYGAVDADGNVSARMTYDHRVLDGSVPSKALVDLERFLKSDLLAELTSMRQASRPGA